MSLRFRLCLFPCFTLRVVGLAVVSAADTPRVEVNNACRDSTTAIHVADVEIKEGA